MNNYLLNIFLLVLLGICSAQSLCAETYSWTDENGTMNFTENYSSIPVKFRKKVLKREEVEYEKPSTPSVVIRDNPVKSEKVQSEKQIGAISNQLKAEPKGTFGGKTGQEWSSEFRAKELEISLLAQKIRQAEELLKKPTGLNKDQINHLPQEIVSLVAQRNEAIKRYNLLNELANRAVVPPEFRK